MRCNEYRELLFERLAGELSADIELNCAAHEAECVTCHAELASFRDVSAKLRAGWPSEDVAPLASVVPAAVPARKWFDVAALWFTRGSSVAVAACLVALVLLRPAVHMDRGGVQIAFAGSPQPQVVATQTAARSEQEVRALVQAAVAAEMQRVQPAAAAAPQRHVGDAGVTQVAMQVRELRDSEARLWQAVQQHNVYLETLWRNTAELRPANVPIVR